MVISYENTIKILEKKYSKSGESCFILGENPHGDEYRLYVILKACTIQEKIMHRKHTVKCAHVGV